MEKENSYFDENQLNNYIEIVDKKQFKNICKTFNDPSWILYIDATALYSGIMTFFLPYRDLKCEEPTKELLNKIINTPENSEIGYFLEVDLENEKN